MVKSEMGDAAVGILGLGGYAPERVMSNAEWAERIDTSDEWIVARTGIRRRRIAAEDQSTVDLAMAAARIALRRGSTTAQEIDEIIVATDTPEVFIPDTAAFIQDRLGAREIPAYDLAGSGCAGFLQALDIARSRVICGADRVLVIGVELLTRLMDWQDRNTCVLFGDGAGAAIVGRGPGAAEILGSVTGTDGSRAEILGLEAGGTRLPFSRASAEANLHHKVVMRGREVFREAVRRMAASSLEVLRASGHGREDLAWVVPHQANLRIIKAVAKKLELPLEKVIINVEDYGNTGSASIPLALWQARERNRVQAGDLVLLTSFGAGFHWGSMLVRF